MTILIYRYDSEGLYTSSSEATMNPLDPGVPLVPANSTLIEPMELTEPYTIQQFVPDIWSIIPDYRGYHYFTPVGGEAVIENVGILPPAEAVEMGEGDHLMQDEEGLWKLMMPEDDLSIYKASKIVDLNNSFGLSLKEEGLNSSALGSEHRYDAEQHNIDWVIACAAVTATIVAETPLITCDDLNGALASKQSRSHTQGQCAQLLLDCMTAIQGMKDKLRGLEIDVDNALDEAAVDLIVWT